MENSQSWYIVKDSTGTCDILPNDRLTTQNDADMMERWGSFASAEDAIARRVGPIRAGKCQPR